MRVSLGIALCGLLVGSATAQRGGMGGGFRGGFGGMGQARAFVGGSFRGGFGGFAGFRPGFNRGFVGNPFFPGNRFFFGNRFRFGNRFFFGSPFFAPDFAFGLSYAPSFYGYGPGFSDYAGYYPPAPAYAQAPSTTIVYPAQTQAAPAAVSAPPASDQPTNQSSAGGSPIYLIAFKDHVIRAAAAYWLDGGTLHYVTLQREEKQAPLDTVDRGFTLQLNRERRVPFQLPAQ